MAMTYSRWRARMPWTLVAVLTALTALGSLGGCRADADTFSLPVSYSMAAPTHSGSSSSGYASSVSQQQPAKKSAVLHHFKTIRGSTSTTTSDDEEQEASTPPTPRYSSSYSSQRVQMHQVQPASRQDEQALIQKQQSYQSLHDYQAMSKNSYQNLASLQEQQPQQDYHQQQQPEYAGYDQHGYQQQQQAYQQQQQAYHDEQQKQQQMQQLAYQQQQHDAWAYQQKVEQYKKKQEKQEDDWKASSSPKTPTASTYTPNVLSYASHGQGAVSVATTTPRQEVPNAVSIEEAVAAAAAVTQTPEQAQLTAQEAQRIFAQQQEYRVRLQQQQQQQLLLQQQPTTAAYERFYEAAAATGVTPNPYATAHLFTTPPTVPGYKLGASPAAANQVMQAALQYYKNGYYADPALLYQLSRSPSSPFHRRVSLAGPAPRPRPRPRPHVHAHPAPHVHAHASGFSRYRPRVGAPHTHAAHGHGPAVQHFFHGPYTMESVAAAAASHHPAGADDSWIEHAIAPIKREDSLLSGLGSAPGTSTALLNGLLVPIVLLGLSIPALGFAYSYLSRRRGFDNDVASFVHDLRPDPETVEYYFKMLQSAIECYNDPKLQHCD